MKNTLILLYHNVVDADNDLYLYDVSLQAFKGQMECLKEFVNPLNVIITFDDGYKSWAKEVLDLLKSFNFKAYFLICIKNLEMGDITRADIIKLKDSGMMIGAHSVTHRFLHTLPKSEVFYELNESKKILKDIIQEEVNYCSIPRGMHTTTVIEAAKKIGYQNVFTSEIGINHNPDFLLKRIPIRRNTKLCDFKDILNGKTIKNMAFNQRLKDRAKQVLGIENYNYLRKILVPRAE